MSVEATITLIGLVGSALAGLIYFLMSSIKTTLREAVNDMMRKIDAFIKELAEVKETVAVKSTMLDYMQREIEGIKKQCWQCQHEQKKDR
jgi:cell shape-determining protein MreC